VGGEEDREGDATLASDLLITGGSHARSCEFCFVSAINLNGVPF
jgi:hypothetical protein